MALRPEDADRYIQEHGPFLEHWTRPENVPGILRRGIVPATHPSEDPAEDEWYGDEEYEPPGPDDIRRNWDHYIETRPGYTYLARPGTIGPGMHENHLKQRPYQVPVRVDLRKLNLRNLEADEDVARDRWPEWKEQLIRGYDGPDPEMAETDLELWDPPNSTWWDAENRYGLADWATDMSVGDPDWTADSLMHPQGGAVAHHGPIPPEAISLHPDYLDKYPPEAQGRFSHTRTCPTCHDPLQGEYGTFCPRCQWSEHDVNIDSDPLSNPPDPTVDMHRGIQAHTIPSHRWAKWFDAVEDMS